jgi:enoyl-CoA hydratase/carnithine racemase
MVEKDVLLSAVADGVMTLTLNRPRKLNAMSHEVSDGLAAGVEAARANRTVRVVVVTGAGTTFSAGADISMVGDFSDRDLAAEEFQSKVRRLQTVFDSLEQLEKPVIAAINGPCVGGAVDLVLACDLRIAIRAAFFVIPEVRLGIIPDLGATQRLPRLVGVSLFLAARRPSAYVSFLSFTSRWFGREPGNAHERSDVIVAATGRGSRRRAPSPG